MMVQPRHNLCLPLAWSLIPFPSKAQLPMSFSLCVQYIGLLVDMSSAPSSVHCAALPGFSISVPACFPRKALLRKEEGPQPANLPRPCLH
jgi:hypothetical protein